MSILGGAFALRFADRIVPRIERVGEQGELASLGPLPIEPSARAPGRMGAGRLSRTEQAIDPAEEARRPSVVVLGAGRVGRVVVKAVRRRGFRCVVAPTATRAASTTWCPSA